jgi:ribosomal protein S18 acetylase RimI-like enzyme
MVEVDLRVRGAEVKDAAELALLMCELGYETTAAEMETRLMSILPNPAYKTLVALINDQICGIIGTFEHSTYEHNDRSGRILALVVKNTMRRHGIGQALIAAAEEDFGRRGIKRISLDTRLTRKEAHRFYESLGYQRNGWRFVKTLG